MMTDTILAKLKEGHRLIKSSQINRLKRKVTEYHIDGWKVTERQFEAIRHMLSAVDNEPLRTKYTLSIKYRE